MAESSGGPARSCTQRDDLPTQVHVFPFGSLPLGTFLPDGDIDCIVVPRYAWPPLHSPPLPPPNRRTCCAPYPRSTVPPEEFKRGWADQLEKALINENTNRGFKKSGGGIRDIQAGIPTRSCRNPRIGRPVSRFPLLAVQVIPAEVQVVKCMIDGIKVDIVMGQAQGLGTLCFLEEMDLVIGHGHLFKRSILLVKAWAYYESRILGSHNFLLSTYALEVLVLFIISMGEERYALDRGSWGGASPSRAHAFPGSFLASSSRQQRVSDPPGGPLRVHGLLCTLRLGHLGDLGLWSAAQGRAGPGPGAAAAGGQGAKSVPSVCSCSAGTGRLPIRWVDAALEGCAPAGC